MPPASDPSSGPAQRTLLLRQGAVPVPVRETAAPGADNGARRTPTPAAALLLRRAQTPSAGRPLRVVRRDGRPHAA